MFKDIYNVYDYLARFTPAFLACIFKLKQKVMCDQSNFVAASAKVRQGVNWMKY